MINIFLKKNIGAMAWGILAISLGLAILPNQQVHAEQQMSVQNIKLWKSEQGLVGIGSCKLSAIENSDFRLVEYTGSQELGFENIRSFSGDVLYKVPNHSLLHLIQGEKAKDRYSYIEVIGSAQGFDQSLGLVDTAKSSEKIEGYVFSESLKGIENHSIHIVKNNKAMIYGKKATDTFWIPKNTGDKFLSIDCGQPLVSPPIVFEVYELSTNLLLGLVAVDPSDSHDLFKNIKTLEIEEMYSTFSNRHKGKKLGQRVSQGSVIGDFGAFFGIGKKSEEEELPAQPAKAVEGATNSSAQANEEDGESADGELEDDNYDDTGEEDASDEFIDEDIPVYEGNLEYVICTSDSQLNVRPYNNMTEVLFKANRHEVVIPMESFNNDERFAVEINGENVVFLKVQFPERDKAIGWVAESYISEVSRCASYQVRLGDDQPIICTESGTVNVRSESLEDILFSIGQFEPVAIRSDAGEASKVFAGDDGSKYEMIPVTFITKDSEEGWVAKEFVKTKKQCEIYKKQDECCGFPIAKRPTESYTTGQRAFGARRDKGKRKHAGVDLYSTDGALVYAVDSGKVRKDIYHFYLDTYAIEVTHNNFVVRYGELYPEPSSGVKGGSTVRMGKSLGKIKKIRSLKVKPMLHFEMYSTKSAAGLNGGGAYKRRSDLKNPTRDMQKWEKQKFGRSY